MRAIAYTANLPVDHPEALVDVVLDDPKPGAYDLLVRIEAVSVNPVDHKVRLGFPTEGPRVLGWDAVGTVEAMGASVVGFSVGDRVWYAGDLTRPGSNAELQCVDARIASHAPSSLTPAEAAALPLTSITAWELLFERFGLPPGKASTGHVLLVAGASGGVGSVLLQLAARLTATTVVAMAGSPASADRVRSLGAHHVVDYKEPLAPQLAALGVGPVTHIASLTHTDRYFAQFVELLVPFGQLALIDDPPALDVSPMKLRSQTLHWELMFTRSMFQTPDLAAQGRLLAEVAGLVDEGVLRTTLTEVLGPMSVETLRTAHRRLEAGLSGGKLVLTRMTA